MTIVYSIEDFKFRYPNSNQSIFISGKLEINQGDVILLQGNSGSGKSTLLLALKGIIPHLINGKFSGKILFNQQDIITLSNTSQIGYLGQNPHNQIICETVYRELAFGLENQCIQPEIIRQKIDFYSNKFKISHLLNCQISNLSGGEKQKINLLSILIMEPEVLLLDEPTAFLDPENALEVITIIKEYSHKKTIIIVEHNIHYLSNLVNRIIQINAAGQVIQRDPSTTNFCPALIEQPCKNSTAFNATKPLLQINNLNFAYKKQTPLLKNLQLNIYAGQIIGILGKNGSGKSSLLQLISKIIPSKNSIFYKQQDISSIKPKEYWQRIALLWQNPENHFLYNSVKLEISPENINQFNLINCTEQNPYCLSEGQKRRLSLAITLKPDIELFLLDEPTFGQDLANREKLASFISMLTMSNKSFIIISHDIAFLQSLTTEIYILDTCLHKYDNEKIYHD